MIRLARASLVLVVALTCALPEAAAEPNVAESAFFYSHRPDPSGDVSESLLKSSLFTGAASVSVPIEIPRGTGGVQPSIALNYSSGRGRGNSGMGWTLELPKISRSLRYGSRAQTWTNSQAVWLLDGNELTNSHGTETDPYGCAAWRYYSTVERYQKILYCQNAAPNDYFIVYEKDGTQSRYGGATNTTLSFGAMTYEYYCLPSRNVDA